ncbi:MAG: GAF domain-containing protein [Candidatus Eisenbacteria bacterium]
MTNTRDDGGPAGERTPLDLLREDLSYLLAFSDALLELVPDAVAVLDGKFRVRACNGPFRKITGAAPGGEISLAGDHPFLRSEVAPGRTLAEALRSLLLEGGARDFRRIGGGRGTGGGAETYRGKAAVWDSGDPESRRLLLWIHRRAAHEEETASRSSTDPSPPRPAGGGAQVPHNQTPSGLAAHTVPLGPEAMISPDRLRLWPPPKGRRVLIADRSPWDAVLLSRAVREAGLEDVTIVESPKEAWEKNDPAGYGLSVVVLPEEKGEEMIDLCRRLTAYAPTVPVLVLADRAAKARDTLGDLPLLGILGKARREENLRIVTEAVFGERFGGEMAGEAEEPEGEPGAAGDPEKTRYGVVLLGAGDGHVGGPAGGPDRPEKDGEDEEGYEEDARSPGGAEPDERLEEGPDGEREEVVAKEEIEETLSTIAPERAPRLETPAPPVPAPTGEVAGLLGALELLLDFRRLAGRVLEMALAMTGGKTGSLMLIDDETRELRILASKGIPEGVARKTRQRLGEGIAGRVAESGEPLLLQGRIGDRRFRGMGGRPDIQSSVCVPLFAGRNVIGTLSVNCPSDSPVLEEKELDRVAVFGRQIGGALDQSRQIERSRLRSFELSVRAEIEAIAFSGEDLNRKLGLIADKIVEMLEVDVCAIYLADAERKALVLQAASGIGVDTLAAYHVPVGKGIIGHVAKERRTLVLRSDPSDQEPVRTYMAVPVLHQTDLKGVVGIEDITRGDFDENRFGLVSSIASSVGLLIGDACAHSDSRKKVTMLSAISEMGVAFTAARDRIGLAKLVAFCAATVLESDVATVRLLRPDAEPGSRDTASYDLLATQGTSMPTPEEPLARLDEKMVAVTAVRGKPCRDRDVRTDEIRPFLEKANTAAVLALPLLSGDDLIGSVVVYRVAGEDRREVGFREHEVEVGVRLADYASAAARQFLPREDDV